MLNQLFYELLFIDLDKESEDAQDIKVQSSKVELNRQYL